jgi:hypothetical protein
LQFKGESAPGLDNKLLTCIEIYQHKSPKS